MEEKEKKELDVVDYREPERPTEQRPVGSVMELLDRILDKGVVIIGDIRISLADIELLKIQIRLLIASVDKAKEIGIDFGWAKAIEEPKTKHELLMKIKELEKELSEKEEKLKEKKEVPVQ